VSVDLRTSYLGLSLRNPICAAASPVTGTLDGLRRVEDAGAALVVLPSLFEEQIEIEEMSTHQLLEYGAEVSPEASGFLPELRYYLNGPDAYLDLIRQAKRSLDIPLIPSLNGFTAGGWARIAKQFQEAGADAIELNVYFLATDVDQTSDEVEKRYLDLVTLVSGLVDIPVAVKVGPYFSAMGNMAKRLARSGAKGLVLFNRFLQPDILLDELEVAPRLVLSTPDELRLALRWIAILRGRVNASLAATGGAHSADDVLKLLLAGADCVQVASCLLRNGPEHVRTLLRGMETWMIDREYASVEQLKGSLSQRNCPDPAAFERANYMKTLMSFTGELV
jgi:dihydroorotate dehydrogenase (fumarate)